MNASVKFLAALELCIRLGFTLRVVTLHRVQVEGNFHAFHTNIQSTQQRCLLVSFD